MGKCHLRFVLVKKKLNLKQMNKKREIKRSFFILLGTINRNSVFDVTCKDKSCQHLENSSHVHVITVLIFRSKVDPTKNRCCRHKSENKYFS